MDATEAHARPNGAHQMIAGLSSENPAARASHSRPGYTLIATIPRAGHTSGHFMDLLLMQKFL